MKSQDLEDRLVLFAIMISMLVDKMPVTLTGKYLAGQLIRSGLSPALNYGEARSAESSGDFIHKMKIVLKELRESFISLRILKKRHIMEDGSGVDKCLDECNELISIFVKSIQTAEKRKKSDIKNR